MLDRQTDRQTESERRKRGMHKERQKGTQRENLDFVSWDIRVGSTPVKRVQSIPFVYPFNSIFGLANTTVAVVVE